MEKSVFVHPTAAIDEGVEIGAGTRLWHWSRVCAGALIGPGCTIGQGVFIGPGARIGARVKIQNNAHIPAGVRLEDEVFCGPSMVIEAGSGARGDAVDGERATTVRRGASIGANGTLAAGIEVGEFAMVGAGSVVSRDVRPFELVRGNPARRAGWVSRAGRRLDFSNGGDAACPVGGERYALRNGRVRAGG